MRRTYDTLMDRLADLAVTAMQQPDIAVQAYWLTLVCTALPAAALSPPTVGMLVQQALSVACLDAWARPLAPQALVQLLRDGDLLEGSGVPPLPRSGKLTWEELLSFGDVVLRVPQAYQPYTAELCEQACRLWRAACRLYGPRPPALAALPDEVLRGVVLFDAGFYFACHEYFETLWGQTGDLASDFYQGLIQVAVAMRHLESHNVRGAIVLLQYGLKRLQRYPGVYKGLALHRFVEQLVALLAYLQALPSAAAYQFDPAQVPCLLGDGA